MFCNAGILCNDFFGHCVFFTGYVFVIGMMFMFFHEVLYVNCWGGSFIKATWLLWHSSHPAVIFTPHFKKIMVYDNSSGLPNVS